jgi:hypothetical protein
MLMNNYNLRKNIAPLPKKKQKLQLVNLWKKQMMICLMKIHKVTFQEWEVHQMNKKNLSKITIF